MSTAAQLQPFLENHPIERAVIASKTRSILPSGTGERVVMVLPGAGSFKDLGAEIMFPVVVGLGDRVRVISVGYPVDVLTVDEALTTVKR